MTELTELKALRPPVNPTVVCVESKGNFNRGFDAVLGVRFPVSTTVEVSKLCLLQAEHPDTYIVDNDNQGGLIVYGHHVHALTRTSLDHQAHDFGVKIARALGLDPKSYVTDLPSTLGVGNGRTGR